MKLQKLLSLFFLFTLCITNLFAEAPTSTYNQIGISYCNIDPAQYYWLSYNHHTVQVEYTHALNRKYSLGAYLGYGLYSELRMHEIQQTSYITNGSVETISTIDTFTFYDHIKTASSLQYGINGIAHLLPMLNLNSSYHDVYINARIGMISMFTTTEGEDIVPQRGHYFNYSLVGGYTFYAWQHVGFFVEYGYNISKHTKRTSARFGMKFDL